MRFVRIGDLFDSQYNQPRQPYWIADNLAQRVFPTDPKSEIAGKHYLHSLPTMDTPEPFKAFFPNEEIGEYEAQMVGKIVNPPGPVLCIVGDMGSGKTTLCNYIGADLIGGEECKSVPLRQRLVAHIDLNDHTGLYGDEDQSTEIIEELYRVICDELRGRLSAAGLVTVDEELSQFWNWEYERYQSRRASKTFSGIFGKLEDTTNLGQFPISKEELGKRKAVRDEILTNDERNLDYLIRLWEYVIQCYYSGDKGCAFVLLDNADQLPPIIQRKLVDIIYTSARSNGPTFIIFLRPETFEFMGFGTGTIDVVEHVGPRPLRVVLDRLERFRTNPYDYYSADQGLSEQQFTTLTDFLVRTLDKMVKDPSNEFSLFIDQVSGKSIRTALIMSHNMFRVSPDDMVNSGYPLHDLTRICVTQGKSQLRWTKAQCISHLFRLTTKEPASLLLKARILFYLNNMMDGTGRISEIYNIMRAFSYPEAHIREGLNDLMTIYCQQVRSNGFSYYQINKVLENDLGHTVSLTDIGRGYIRNVIYNTHYLQEVMLDTYVNAAKFPPSVKFRYLRQKFDLLRLFLQQIFDIDLYETEYFIERQGLPAYREAFGTHLVSLDIIHGVYPVAYAILRNMADTYPDYQEQHHQVIRNYNKLVENIENSNNLLLGIAIDSIVKEPQVE